jgi:hypothetical protein
MENSIKPPIGLLPKRLYEYRTKEKRFIDLCGAVSRYYNAGEKINILNMESKTDTRFGKSFPVLLNIASAIAAFIYTENPKRYRGDISTWEQQYKIFGLPVYKYSISPDVQGFSLKRKSPQSARYFEQPGRRLEDYIVTISKERFQQEFKGNKYLLPLNYRIKSD